MPATSKNANSLLSGELIDTRNSEEHFQVSNEAPGNIMCQPIFGILRTPRPWDEHSNNDPPPGPASYAPLKRQTTPKSRHFEPPESKKSKLYSPMESVIGQILLRAVGEQAIPKFAVEDG